MLRDPRKRLIIVTVSLLAMVFAMLFGANWGYNQYWSDRTALQMVEWIADNGLSVEADEADRTSAAQNEPDMPETLKDSSGNFPIIRVTVDREGNILSQEAGGGVGEHRVSQDLIRRILENDTADWKEGKYIYSIREAGDYNKLIILTDSTRYARRLQLVTCVALSAGESVLLAPVTIYLSRIIARPVRRSLRREKEFVSDASHELKTSLGAININAQALSADVGENRHVQNILSETLSMNRLTERLLTLARIEESEPDRQTRFSLSDEVGGMVLTYESAAFERRAGYRYDIEDGISMTGNPDEFRQLAALLLENAVKYVDEGGRIETRLFRNRQHVVFEVSNTGEGIPPEELPRIFERFHGKTDPDLHDSFGLGLAIARAITEKYGGTITASSSQDGMTVFRARW